MKFKVLKGTPLFDKLSNARKEMRRCNKAALALIKELGYESGRRKGHCLSGGISCFKINGEKPKGWRKQSDGYFPSPIKKNAEVLAKIAALPIAEYSLINEPLNYRWNDQELEAGNTFQFCPGVCWKNDYILIHIGELNRYAPVADMIEILDSEFKALSS